LHNHLFELVITERTIIVNIKLFQKKEPSIVIDKIISLLSKIAISNVSVDINHVVAFTLLFIELYYLSVSCDQLRIVSCTTDLSYYFVS
jgi:hypothetical protein